MDSLFRSIITNKDVANLSNIFPNGGRYCLHETLEDELHVMLIHAEPKNKYPKHKHTDTKEFYVILEGEMQIDIWDPFGARSTIKMSTKKKSDVISFVVEKNTWHSTTAGPHGVKFFEFRSGPFVKENTILESKKNDKL